MEQKKIENLDRNILYDKFLQIEGYAYRGKKLIEDHEMDLAKQAALRIRKDLNELLILFKVNPNEGGD